MSLDLTIDPTQLSVSATLWPAVHETYADGELVTGADNLVIARRTLDALNALRLSALLPLEALTPAAASGVNIGAAVMPHAGWGIVYRGDAGYSRGTGGHLNVKHTVSSLANYYFVGCAGPGYGFIAHGKASTLGTAQWFGAGLTLPSSNSFNFICRPYDAVWTPYNTGRFIVTGYDDFNTQGRIETTPNELAGWNTNASIASAFAARLAVGGSGADAGRYVLAVRWENASVVYASADGGVTWAAVSHGIAGSATIKGVAYDDVRNRWVIVRGQTAYTATDLGNPTTWTAQGNMPGYDAADPSTATGSSGLVCIGGGILIGLIPKDASLDEWFLNYSADGGVSWVTIARFSGSADTVKGWGRPDRLIWSNGRLIIPFTTASDPVVLVSRWVP